MGAYTALTLVAMVVVVALELFVIRSGIFRRRAYWLALGICALFQFPVDGWLTKLSSVIVIYNSEVFSGIRIGWDSPIEDWGFGFALMTLALALWVRQGDGDDDDRSTSRSVRRTATPGQQNDEQNTTMTGDRRSVEERVDA
jgi:lycopene cyclase domain-containing protein